MLQLSFMVGDASCRTFMELVLPYRSTELGIYPYPTRKHVSSKARALLDYLADCFVGKNWMD